VTGSGDGDAAERAERARRLREQIDRRRNADVPPSRPRNPREFVEEKMREERERRRERERGDCDDDPAAE
jgi:hypothetical protein